MNDSSNSESLSGTTQYRLKTYSKLPIYVVEYHHEALPFIYQSIGAKYLPVSGNTIIHLDSHPDLGIPLGMPANLCYDKNQLFDQLSIENWIMPGAYAGIFENILWIKPEWATQIPEGLHNIKIGEEKATKEIKVSSPLQYFLGEAVYASENKMDQVKNINLDVVTLSHTENKAEDLLATESAMKKYVKSDDKYILDIDLDFFSTKNPFLEIYEKADMYNHLRKLYAFSCKEGSCSGDPNTLTALTETRLKQLNELKSVFRYLEENLSLDEAPEELTSLSCYLGVKDLYKKIQAAYPDTDIEWMIVHDAGCTIDENEIPHHVTDKKSLDHYLNNVFPAFLDKLPGRPTIVTISRSSEDDYCPKEDVEFIQDAVLSALKNKFGDVNITLDYCDDDEDIPILVPPAGFRD